MLIRLHMLELSIGKGRQVINSSECQAWVGTATALSGVFKASYTICYNGCSVRGVCALGSSTFNMGYILHGGLVS